MVAADLLDTKGNLDSSLRDRIIQQAFHRGLLLIGCGQAALRFCPPLVIDRDQIHIALEILTDLLSKNETC
jgi:4-aminobutyrate aminotransferase